MRSCRGLLISLPFVAAMTVLVVNDHVLKQAWPGLVTGKLSDVAGVAMIALLLTAVTARRSIGFAATSIGFLFLKTVPGAAVLAAPVLGGVTLTDPTDLVALAVLAPLWRWVGGISHRRQGNHQAWLLPLQIVAMSAAVLATTASSCEGEGVLGVVVVDDMLFATTVTDVFESADGGATWWKSDVASWDERLDRPFSETRTDCVGPDRCVEIVPPEFGRSTVLSIDEVALGDRRSILTVTADQRQELSTVVRPQCGDGFFDSISVIDPGDGQHVVVTMGAGGVLHHRPDQTWEWVAVGGHGLRSDQVDAEPFGFGARSTIPTDSWERWPFELVAALLVLGPLSVALAIIPIVRLARAHHRDPAVGIVTCVVVSLCLGVASLFVFTLVGGFGDRAGAAIGSVAIAAIAVCTVTPLLAWYGRPRRRAGWQPPDPASRAG